MSCFIVTVKNKRLFTIADHTSIALRVSCKGNCHVTFVALQTLFTLCIFLLFGNPFSYLPQLLSHQLPSVMCDRGVARQHRANAIKVCLLLKETDRPRWPSETRRPVFAPGMTLPHQSLARQTNSNTTSCADGRGGPVQYGFRGSTVWPSLHPSGIC